ncbi:MAG: copper chaperone PCu(A)C [Paraperlucidibaca sp.]
MKLFVLAGALVLTSGVALAAPVITAHEAWVREVPPVSPVAAMFVRLHNASDKPVAITAMQSPAAERVEWHDMTMAAGHMRMTQRHQIALPPGDSVLAASASHLMLMALRKPLRVGDQVPVSMTLANGETLALTATVRATQPMARPTNKPMSMPHDH